MESVYNVTPGLESLLVPIAGLMADPRNARKHPARSIQGIMESLQRFGQQRPIVLKADGIEVAAGNGTMDAASRLGWTHIAAVTSNLDGAEATAFGLADNRTAELSEWDYEQVADLIKELQAQEVPIENLGWADYELDPLLSATWEKDEAKGDLGKDHKREDDKKAEHHIKLPTESNETIQRAIAKARFEMENPEAYEGEAVEHICRWYLQHDDPAGV